MILKSADDKTPQLAQLERWAADTTLSAAQKKWASDELFRLRMGIQGERDAAYYLDSHFKDSPDHMVIHDLRLEVEGDVAQIDHMVFYRAGGVYLFETKNYNGNLLINPHGEFTAEYGRVRYGIPSPLEQSRRHERVLHKLFDRLDIGARTQRALDMHHLVLVHPKAIIKRPTEKQFSTQNVIKSDQFPDWHAKFADRNLGALGALKLMANLRSRETLQEWGEKLIRQHRPPPLRKMPEYLAAKAVTAQTPATPKPAETLQKPVAPTATQPPPSAVSPDKAHLVKKLICAECGAKISFPEGKFCWGNEKRFGGLQYCREHQSGF